MRDNLSKKLSGKHKVNLVNFGNLEGKVKSKISDSIKDFTTALENLNRNLSPANEK